MDLHDDEALAVDGLSLELDDHVLRITLDRPDRRNAVTDEIVAGLITAIDRAGSSDEVRAILLTGRGDHFCSGFDLSTRTAPGDRKPRAGATQRRMNHQVNRLMPVLLECQTPIVVAARGWSIGLGLNLALAADFAVVADDARLWAPFVGFGFTPDSGSSWLLPRLAGVARAKEMLLLGRKVSGVDAAAWGLVHRSVPDEELDAAAEALARELADRPTVAVGLAKLLIHRGLTSDLDRHLHEEAMALELSSRSEDFAEYRRAQRDRRDPEFTGR